MLAIGDKCEFVANDDFMAPLLFETLFSADRGGVDDDKVRCCDTGCDGNEEFIVSSIGEHPIPAAMGFITKLSSFRGTGSFILTAADDR
jgi:hypothetical protein